LKFLKKLIFPEKKLLPFGGFYVPNCCKLQRKSADFHSSDACIPNCCKLWWKSADFHSSDACCIPNSFQTAVRCGGSQLIGRETRVANLGDFSPKYANLGTFGNQKICWEFLKNDF
jgi:hypothetical protein